MIKLYWSMLVDMVVDLEPGRRPWWGGGTEDWWNVERVGIVPWNTVLYSNVLKNVGWQKDRVDEEVRSDNDHRVVSGVTKLRTSDGANKKSMCERILGQSKSKIKNGPKCVSWLSSYVENIMVRSWCHRCLDVDMGYSSLNLRSAKMWRQKKKKGRRRDCVLEQLNDF